MSLSNYNFFKVPPLIKVAFFILLVSFFIIQGSASAAPPIPSIGSTLPDSSDFTQGSNVDIVVASYSPPAYNLDAPKSVVRIYTRDANGTFRIIDGGQGCNSGDAGNVNTRFRGWAMWAAKSRTDYGISGGYYTNGGEKSSTPYFYTGNGIGIPGVTFTDNEAGCGSRTVGYSLREDSRVPVNATGALQPYAGWYAFEIQAEITSGAGWNAFKVQVPNGRVSLYDGSGEKFALKARSGSGVGNFHMAFQAGCTLKEGKYDDAKIKWFDVDAGVSNQGYQNPVRAHVYEYGPGGGPTNRSGGSWSNGRLDINLTSGNDVPDERTINIRGNYKYVLVMDNIYDSNGIQFQLPYDSWNVTRDCNYEDWELGVESQVRINGGPWLDSGVHRANPGDRVEWRHIATRKSGEGLVTFDRQRIAETNGSETGRTGAAKITDSPDNRWVQGPLDLKNIEESDRGKRFCQWYRVWPGNESGSISEKNTQGRKACVQVGQGQQDQPFSDGKTQVKRDNEPGWHDLVTDAEPGQAIQFRSKLSYRNHTDNIGLGAVERRTSYFGNYDFTPQLMPPHWTWNWESNINTTPIAGDIAPGTNLCQTAHGDYLLNEGTEDEPEYKTYSRDTNLACGQVVGGKSSAAVDGPNIVEQGQTVSLNGGIRTNGFHRLDPNYGYNVICRYKVLFQSEELVPETNCNNFIEGNGDIFNSHTYRIPDDAPMGSRYCMIVSIAPGGSTINGPNDNLIGEREIHKCVEVVGGKTGIAASVSTDAAEPTDYVELYGTSNTSNFHNAGQGYAYNVACSYSVRYMRAGYGGGTSTIQSGPCTYSVAGNGAMRVVTAAFNIPNSTSYIGNQICMFINIAPAGSNINGPNNNLMGYPTSSTSCMEIVAKPYVKAYGGDVSAGNSFSNTGESCVNGNASAIGWNVWTGSYHKGSGAHLAVFAQNVIQQFSSGQNIPRVAGTEYGYGPVRLSFANTTTNEAIGAYGNTGGDYGGRFMGGTCITDYYGMKPKNPAPMVWQNINKANADAAAGNHTPVYEVPSGAGGVTLGAGGGNEIEMANSTTLYVDGDVYIRGNITGATGMTAVAQIPTFTVIARGNIYISPNVTQLYGTYIAQPKNDRSAGNIYTCADGPGGIYNFVDPANQNNYGRCQNQLFVTGSFVANKVHLLRNNGSMYQDDGGKVPNSATTTRAGEVFLYNPLNWIRGTTSSTTQSNTTYDAITTLPPVL